MTRDDPDRAMIHIQLWWLQEIQIQQWWSRSSDDPDLVQWWWSRSSDDPDPVMIFYNDPDPNPDRMMIQIQFYDDPDREMIQIQMTWSWRRLEDEDVPVDTEKKISAKNRVERIPS